MAKRRYPVHKVEPLFARYLRHYGFFTGLVAVAIWVATDPGGIAVDWGVRLRKAGAPAVVVWTIFFVSGLNLSPARLRSGVSDVAVIVLSLVGGYVAAPLVAGALGMLPLESGIRTGLFLVAAMPTTLSSGVVLTAAAGGNEAAALAATLASNALGVVAVPWVLEFLTGWGGGAFPSGSMPKAVLALKLAVLVLAPLALGLGIRSRIPERVRKRGASLNPALVILMVWIGLAGSRAAVMASPRALAVSAGLSVLFHAFVWGFLFTAAWLARIGPGRREALIITGGQKTLPLALLLQTRLFPGNAEVLVVSVVHHLVHLVMDGYLAGVLRRLRP